MSDNKRMLNRDQSNLKVIFRASRPSFLILTPVCVFLSWSFVTYNHIETEAYLLVLTLIGAISAHVSVNLLNEYSDFKSGLDLKTDKTKFSGGSGALPDNPDAAKVVFTAAITFLILTSLIGLFFVWKYNWQILPIGLSGLILIITYTKWINRNPFLCLIAPGTGFGFFMIAGSYFVLTGEYSPTLWLVCLISFFLVNNLLLLNQFPDIAADKEAGRNHVLIAYGIKAGDIFYCLFSVMVIVVIMVAIFTGTFPKLSFITLLPMTLAFYALFGAIKHGDNLGSYEKYLGSNVAATLLTLTLLGASLIYTV